MPNWCECDLVVRGKDEEIDRMLQETENVKFNKIIPYPEEFVKADKIVEDYGPDFWALSDEEKQAKGLPLKDGFNRGGYEWRCEHWGTKWDSDFQVVQRKQKLVKLTGDTAWSPPLPAIVAASNRYPTLKFDLRYYEGAMQFKGRLVVRNGEMLERMEGVYSGGRGG